MPSRELNPAATDVNLPKKLIAPVPCNGGRLERAGAFQAVAFVMEWMVIEQRRKQRFDLKLPFEIRRPGDDQKTTGDTQNLSSSGVLFSVSGPVRIGEPIEYYIILPKAPGTNHPMRLRCFGTVVREAPESVFAATLERHEFVRDPEN